MIDRRKRYNVCPASSHPGDALQIDLGRLYESGLGWGSSGNIPDLSRCVFTACGKVFAVVRELYPISGLGEGSLGHNTVKLFHIPQQHESWTECIAPAPGRDSQLAPVRGETERHDARKSR